MDYRISTNGLLHELSGWNRFLRRKVNLIACGGTALTLLGLKETTKDIDLMVPVVNEYNYLIGILKKLGFKSVTGNGWSRDKKYVFDLFRGNYIHTTELLESPLSVEGNISFEEFAFIYLGILNYYDLIISKLFRGDQVDFEDCIILYEGKKSQIDIDKLKRRFKETASHDISTDKVMKKLQVFLKRIRKEQRYDK